MRHRTDAAARRCRIAALLLAAASAAGLTAAQADDRPPAKRGSAVSAEWAALTPAQRQSLAPLQQEWPRLGDGRRQKWLEVAARFPSMPPDERQRVQERMAEWVRLTPQERNRARLQFQESRQWSPDAQDRQARWEAYQALSPEEREALVQRARPAAPSTAMAKPSAATAVNKRNVVAAPARPPATTRPSATPSTIPAPTGATTKLLSTRAAPPTHQQAGLPKIAATPEFVDPATLLPRRGPQGAAIVGAPTPAAEP